MSKQQNHNEQEQQSLEKTESLLPAHAKLTHKHLFSLLKFYLIIALILPIEPKDFFSQSLNEFLNTYCNGQYLPISLSGTWLFPSFSREFYFGGKVLIIAAFYITPLLGFCSAFILKFKLTTEEWQHMMQYHAEPPEGDRESGFRAIILMMIVLTASNCFLATIYLPLDGHYLFSGHYYRFLMLNFFCQSFNFLIAQSLTLDLITLFSTIFRSITKKR